MERTPLNQREKDGEQVVPDREVARTLQVADEGAAGLRVVLFQTTVSTLPTSSDRAQPKRSSTSHAPRSLGPQKQED